MQVFRMALLVLALDGACLISTANANAADTGMCVAAYDALAQEQATMGAAGASSIGKIAPNYNKIKFADRSTKIKTKYPNDPSVKYGMIGSTSASTYQRLFYLSVVQAETEEKFDQEAMSVLELAAKCDKDEGFVPALVISTGPKPKAIATAKPIPSIPAKPAPKPPAQVAAQPARFMPTDDVTCLASYALTSQTHAAEPDASIRLDARLKASATAFMTQNKASRTAMQEAAKARIQELSDGIMQRKFDNVVLEHNSQACDRKYMLPM